jgi:hypothetical protein
LRACHCRHVARTQKHGAPKRRCQRCRND